MSTICLWLLLYWFIVCLSWYISQGDGTWHFLAHPQPLWYLAPSYSNYLEYLLYLASDWVYSSVYMLTLPRAVCCCLGRNITVPRIIRFLSRLVLSLVVFASFYLWSNCLSHTPGPQSFTKQVCYLRMSISNLKAFYLSVVYLDRKPWHPPATKDNFVTSGGQMALTKRT